MHRAPLAQREYLVVRVVGKTPRPAETTTRHCQSGSEGRSFGADPDRRFLGLCYGVQTRSLASCLRHQPRQEPRALTRMRGSVRGDWRKPVPYRDGDHRGAVSARVSVLQHSTRTLPSADCWRGQSGSLWHCRWGMCRIRVKSCHSGPQSWP